MLSIFAIVTIHAYNSGRGEIHMTVKEKLARIIKDLPEEIAAQVFDFALFIKEKRREEQETQELAKSPAFARLARRALKEIDRGETISLNELKKEIHR
ncbi:MAG: hypothetical protein AB1546_10740 [bacterium]